MDGEEEDGMHRYQRKLPFVDIIESLGGSAKNPPGRPATARFGCQVAWIGRPHWRNNLWEEKGDGGGACAPVTNLDHGSRSLSSSALTGDRCCWLRE